jgi:SAM-dependent methyltransferase
MNRPGILPDEDASAVAGRLRELLPPPLVPVFGASFVRSHRRYDEFVYRLVLEVARASGLETALRVAGSLEDVASRTGLDHHQALVPLDWMLRLLVFRGALEEVNGGFRARGGLPVLDPALLRDDQLRDDPSWAPAYVMAEAAARDYPAFLRGEISGEEVLFSPRRLRLWVDYFSNDHGLYVVNNRIGAIAFEQWLPRADAAVLELGGGLGSGALAVLERLESTGRLHQIREYRFTEFVPAFLRRGQQALHARWPAAGVLTFAALDMNRPFAEQGVAAASRSVVYAVNTLHVAYDLDITLSEIWRALEPGGRLIVSECVRPYSRHPIYADFIFNLIETFRSPRLHPRYRPGGGFLTPEQWQAAMDAAGFTDVQLLPDVPRLREHVPDFYVAAIAATRP